MIVSVLSAAVVFASLHEPDTAKYLMGKVCHCRLRWCGARTILCNTFRSGALLVRSEPCLVFISIRYTPLTHALTHTVHVHAFSLPRALLVCLRCCPACVAVSTWVQHALTFHSCLFTEAELARVYLFTCALATPPSKPARILFQIKSSRPEGVDPKFDCAWRKYAYKYAAQLQPSLVRNVFVRIYFFFGSVL